jgi:hypothetical protein
MLLTFQVLSYHIHQSELEDRHLSWEGAGDEVDDNLQVDGEVDGDVECADNGVVDGASATHGILPRDDAATVSTDVRELPLGVERPAVDVSRNISEVPQAASPVELALTFSRCEKQKMTNE